MWATLYSESSLPSYLHYRRGSLLLFAAAVVLVWLVFFLYHLPSEAFFYALALFAAFAAVISAGDYIRYRRKRRILQNLLACVDNTVFALPRPDSALEAEYQALLQAVCESRAAAISDNENRYRDTIDYFSLWVHQIKTPIAAAQLLLQQSGETNRRELSAEIFKIEQYVEMVLSYLRLGSDHTDYVFRRCSLDDIVRGCARKYAKLFILKRISLEFSGTGLSVVTDEKWLSFVIEQLLSNALKYTPAGGRIRILKDGPCLVIADSGIGIRKEDLPRIFEKGFTGYNGRAHKKSTGIGLYLCRQITQQLNHGLSITSTPGAGTRVYLHFYDAPLMPE